MDLAHIIKEKLHFQILESMVLQLIWSLLWEARDHFLMILIIFTLMYGFGTRYEGKSTFSDIGIDVSAADMEPPPGSSGAFSNDINNI